MYKDVAGNYTFVTARIMHKDFLDSQFVWPNRDDLEF